MARRGKSHLKGAQSLNRKLARMEPEVVSELVEENERAIRLVQRFVVRNVPVRTGKAKRLLSTKSAIGKKRKGLVWEFGLRTKRLVKELFYLQFSEFGTKGGVVKGGPFAGARIPPQPARPVFRVVLKRLGRRIRKRRQKALSNVLRRVANGK
jgi:hypothetical protein